MHQFMDRGWLRLYCMQLADEVIGIFYCYAFRGVLFHFQGGFDPRHEQLRIGQCLMAYAIESAIGEGCTGLDMLRGDYEYKRRWAPSVRTTYTVSITRPTLAAKVDRVVRRVLIPIKSRMTRLVRKSANIVPAGVSVVDKEM
jgi:CelD/BcsL family acetyltransferase involved in cellulose biosynthesis